MEINGVEFTYDTACEIREASRRCYSISQDKEFINYPIGSPSVESLKSTIGDLQTAFQFGAVWAIINKVGQK